MTGAAARARTAHGRVTLREGAAPSLADWSRLFDPINRYGLVLINSHGCSDRLQPAGGPGPDRRHPPSVPTAVLMIHSFSAADPNDPETIAGRWLANGAFVYFGSMNEPYLQSFRPPRLVAGLVAEGVPLGRRDPRDWPPSRSASHGVWSTSAIPSSRCDARPAGPRLGQWARRWPTGLPIPRHSPSGPTPARRTRSG